MASEEINVIYEDTVASGAIQNQLNLLLSSKNVNILM
jgi:hypothetical protein